MVCKIEIKNTFLISFIINMVKNKKGGSGHKKMARKNVAPKGGYNRKLRLVKEEGEIYARITAISGGGHAVIMCADKKLRTLVIRGKFRGRNKRDNTIKLNSIVIAGLRSHTMGEVVSGTKKKEKADLLYVYNNNEIEELKKIPVIYNIMSDDVKNEAESDVIFDRSFGDEIDESQLKDLGTEQKNKKITIGETEFDWDDI
jgi:translation initiation factor IF-1